MERGLLNGTASQNGTDASEWQDWGDGDDSGDDIVFDTSQQVVSPRGFHPQSVIPTHRHHHEDQHPQGSQLPFQVHIPLPNAWSNNPHAQQAAQSAAAIMNMIIYHLRTHIIPFAITLIHNMITLLGALLHWIHLTWKSDQTQQAILHAWESCLSLVAFVRKSKIRTALVVVFCALVMITTIIQHTWQHPATLEGSSKELELVKQRSAYTGLRGKSMDLDADLDAKQNRVYGNRVMDGTTSSLQTNVAEIPIAESESRGNVDVHEEEPAIEPNVEQKSNEQGTAENEEAREDKEDAVLQEPLESRDEHDDRIPPPADGSMTEQRSSADSSTEKDQESWHADETREGKRAESNPVAQGLEPGAGEASRGERLADGSLKQGIRNTQEEATVSEGTAAREEQSERSQATQSSLNEELQEAASLNGESGDSASADESSEQQKRESRTEHRKHRDEDSLHNGSRAGNAHHEIAEQGQVGEIPRDQTLEEKASAPLAGSTGQKLEEAIAPKEEPGNSDNSSSRNESHDRESEEGEVASTHQLVGSLSSPKGYSPIQRETQEQETSAEAPDEATRANQTNQAKMTPEPDHATLRDDADSGTSRRDKDAGTADDLDHLASSAAASSREDIASSVQSGTDVESSRTGDQTTESKEVDTESYDARFAGSQVSEQETNPNLDADLVEEERQSEAFLKSQADDGSRSRRESGSRTVSKFGVDEDRNDLNDKKEYSKSDDFAAEDEKSAHSRDTDESGGHRGRADENDRWSHEPGEQRTGTDLPFGKTPRRRSDTGLDKDPGNPSSQSRLMRRSEDETNWRSSTSSHWYEARLVPAFREPSSWPLRLRQALNAPPNCPQRPGRNYDSHPIVVYNMGSIMYPRISDPDTGLIYGMYNSTLKAYDRLCPVPCRATEDPNEAYIDLVLNDDFRVSQPDICPLTKFGHATMESDVYYADTKPDALAQRYDFFATPHLNSDVPLVYLNREQYDLWTPPEPKDKLAIAIISNCDKAHSDRLQYIQEMIDAGLDLDFYGRCGNRGGYHGNRTALQGRYKFTLAFENSRAADYVTEKMYIAMQAGSVPVVRGAPNIAKFAPPQSYIDSTEFESPKRLVEYLKLLDSNPAEYNKYLEYKKEPHLMDDFLSKTSDIHSFCRACIWAKQVMEYELGIRRK